MYILGVALNILGVALKLSSPANKFVFVLCCADWNLQFDVQNTLHKKHVVFVSVMRVTDTISDIPEAKPFHVSFR